MTRGRTLSVAVRYEKGMNCLDGSCLHLLRKLPPKRAFVRSICKNLDEIQVAKVKMPNGEFWANIKTGSLFDVKTLHCVSGKLQIIKMVQE